MGTIIRYPQREIEKLIIYSQFCTSPACWKWFFFFFFFSVLPSPPRLQHQRLRGATHWSSHTQTGRRKAQKQWGKTGRCALAGTLARPVQPTGGAVIRLLFKTSGVFALLQSHIHTTQLPVKQPCSFSTNPCCLIYHFFLVLVTFFCHLRGCCARNLC